ncbi:retrotransposon protein, putative, ty1-copia subclass [Tanacetum coccineum]|uniref:Retrotransposon protein, putative, ty1-copia subclass n=1 Tax=Tanacetum coccineum TaxID=301880 RepID=A0ABQ5HP38_9ASTR
MKGYMDQLQALGKPYDNDMAINLINRSLNKDFGDFVRTSICIAVWSRHIKGIANGKADKTKQVVCRLITKTKQKPPQKEGKSKRRIKLVHLCNVVGHWIDGTGPLPRRVANQIMNKMAVHGHLLQLHGIYSEKEAFLWRAISACGNGAHSGKEKVGLNSSYLWLCRLALLAKTRMLNASTRYGYVYLPETLIMRSGRFYERESLFVSRFSGRDYDLEEDHMDTLPSENTSEIPVEPESLGPPPELIPIRRSERNKSAPNRLNLNIEVEDDVVGDLGEPANYKATMLDLISEIHTYKARLVAKGCTQTYGIDYEETFSPVADIRAIRILIAIAAYYDYEIWQMDVKTAFLKWPDLVVLLKLGQSISSESKELYWVAVKHLGSIFPWQSDKDDTKYQRVLSLASMEEQ